MLLIQKRDFHLQLPALPSQNFVTLICTYCPHSYYELDIERCSQKRELPIQTLNTVAGSSIVLISLVVNSTTFNHTAILATSKWQQLLTTSTPDSLALVWFWAQDPCGSPPNRCRGRISSPAIPSTQHSLENVRRRDVLGHGAAA